MLVGDYTVFVEKEKNPQHFCRGYIFWSYTTAGMRSAPYG